MKLYVHHSVLLALALVALSSAFLIPTYTIPYPTSQQRRRESVITAGLFDGFNAERARQKEEDYQKQQEILRARQDEGKQRQYFSEVNKRRAEVSKNINEKFNLAKGTCVILRVCVCVYAWMGRKMGELTDLRYLFPICYALISSPTHIHTRARAQNRQGRKDTGPRHQMDGTPQARQNQGP